MATNAPSTVRARHLRERRSRGVVLVAPVEVGEGGIDLLVRNGLLKEHETRDRKAVGEACLAALEQWSAHHDPRTIAQALLASVLNIKSHSSMSCTLVLCHINKMLF